MKILHYSLGFPPYRTGGLTKFCIDMMHQQKKIGHRVALLWPGQMKFVKKRVSVQQRKMQDGIDSFEIINPLPVSYDEGIGDILAFTASCDKAVYLKFLSDYRPDVIHVHTFMGLHRELMEAAKELRIRTVFSIHDFFAICPKVTLFKGGEVCDSAENCEECPECNLTALSINKIILLQTPLYRVMKDNKIVKKLRWEHRSKYLNGEVNTIVESNYVETTAADYKKLRKYYSSMLGLFDKIHANSTVTRDVFEKYFNSVDAQVIHITHADINDNRQKKEFLPEKLRLTYLGSDGGGKGFFLLKAALDELWLSKKDFDLNIYFMPQEISPYMKTHDKYTYNQLEGIFTNTDVLIAPSIWYETFGYTVLEALSYGVPVIVSDSVGAKDIIPEGCGILIEKINKDRLREAIQRLDTSKLEAMNQNILDKVEIMNIEEMVTEIMEACY